MTALRNRPVAHTFLPSFDNASGRLCQERLGSLSKYDGNGAKRSLKEWISSLLFHFIQFVNCWRIFLELNSKGLYLIWEKEKENCCLIFTSPKFVNTKFHVAPSWHALKDWWNKGNVRWFLREQTSDKVCQYKKSRSSLFILGKRKWRTFYLEDAYGKLLVKVFIVTLFGSNSDRRCPITL